MIEYKDRVESVLIKHKSARDNDLELYLRVISSHHLLRNDEARKVFRILISLDMQGKIPKFESISRVRRKLQQDDESLRGELYDVRQASQKTKRKEPGYD